MRYCNGQLVYPSLDFLLKCYLFLCNEALLLSNAKLVDVKDLIFPFGGGRCTTKLV